VIEKRDESNCRWRGKDSLLGLVVACGLRLHFGRSLSGARFIEVASVRVGSARNEFEGSSAEMALECNDSRAPLTPQLPRIEGGSAAEPLGPARSPSSLGSIAAALRGWEDGESGETFDGLLHYLDENEWPSGEGGAAHGAAVIDEIVVSEFNGVTLHLSDKTGTGYKGVFANKSNGQGKKVRHLRPYKAQAFELGKSKPLGSWVRSSRKSRQLSRTLSGMRPLKS